MKKELFDSYEAMSQEEKEELILIQKIRQNIKYFVGPENIVSKLVSLIDDSEHFKFINERNRKYISKKKPLFIIVLKPESIKDVDLLYLKQPNKDDFFINNRTNVKYNNDIEWIQSKVYQEIIRPYSDYLMEYLTDNEKFNAILKENGIDNTKISKETIRLITMTSSVMFAIKVDLKNDRIYLECAI